MRTRARRARAFTAWSRKPEIPRWVCSAYRDGRAVGWVSVAPRDDYERLTNSRVRPKLDDVPVWSVVCFVVSKSERGNGLTSRLLDAAARSMRSTTARPASRPTRRYGWRPGPGRPRLYGWLLSTFTAAGFRSFARSIRPAIEGPPGDRPPRPLTAFTSVVRRRRHRPHEHRPQRTPEEQDGSRRANAEDGTTLDPTPRTRATAIIARPAPMRTMKRQPVRATPPRASRPRAQRVDVRDLDPRAGSPQQVVPCPLRRVHQPLAGDVQPRGSGGRRAFVAGQRPVRVDGSNAGPPRPLDRIRRRRRRRR